MSESELNPESINRWNWIRVEKSWQAGGVVYAKALNQKGA